MVDMAAYKNDYSLKEDPMMYELHEIRNKMASEKLSPEDFRSRAEKLRQEYNLPPTVDIPLARPVTSHN